MVYLYAIGMAILFGVLVTLARREETRTGWPMLTTCLGLFLFVSFFFREIRFREEPWWLAIMIGVMTALLCYVRFDLQEHARLSEDSSTSLRERVFSEPSHRLGAWAAVVLGSIIFGGTAILLWRSTEETAFLLLIVLLALIFALIGTADLLPKGQRMLAGFLRIAAGMCLLICIVLLIIAIMHTT
jgi:UDP-N-acetylmuramyl pentapeptide phosphotransferase/UDP-N-acetylglucosamine-1-phosphate transferase